MRIAIIGATGGTGRAFVEGAAARGHAVRALARTPAKLVGAPAGVEVVRADGRDRASLVEALRPGFDAVVSIVGAAGLWEARQTTDLYSTTVTHLLAAMADTGNRRLVVVGSAGVTPQPADGWFYVNVLKRFFLEPMYADMRRMSALLQTSGTEWTEVRPPYLLNGAATGEIRERRGQPLDDDRNMRRADLAAFLLRAVEAPEKYRHTVIYVSG